MKNEKEKLKKCIMGILLIFSFSMLSTELLPMAGTPMVVEAAKPKISMKKITLIKGQSKTLKITSTKQKVKWSSNKKSIATVTQKGKVTAKKRGKAIISAKVGKKTYKCTVTVEEPKLNKKSISIDVNKTQTLKVSGTKQKITWSSSDKKIAKVSNEGVVTGVKAGNATVSAKVGNKKYNCKVTVKKPAKKEPQINGKLFSDQSATKVLLLILENEGDLPLSVDDFFLLTNGNSNTGLWLIDYSAMFIDSYTIMPGREERLALCRGNYDYFRVYRDSICSFTFWYDNVHYFATINYEGGGDYIEYGGKASSKVNVSVREATLLDETIGLTKSVSKSKNEKFYDTLNRKIENQK